MRKLGCRLMGGMLMILFAADSQITFAGDAVLSWDPGVESDLAGYTLYYGTTPGGPYDGISSTAGMNSPVDVGHQTTVTVTGLDSGTFYFTVTAYDTSNNQSGFSDEVSKTFSTSDTTPPVISLVAAGNITGADATITWTTNEAATSQVEYGTTTAYGSSTAPDFALVTGHSVTLTGLAASTAYHYRVMSADAAGNLAASGDNTFTIPSAPDTPPPDDAPTPDNTPAPDAAALPTTEQDSTIAGGCGTIRPTGGDPPGPGQAADLMLLALVIALTLLRNALRRAAPGNAPPPVFRLTRGLGRTMLGSLSSVQSLGDLKMGTFPFFRTALAALIPVLSACGSGNVTSDNPSPAAGPGSASETLTLTWGPPTANADGTSPVADLAGYKVYYGIAPRTYGDPINVGDATTFPVTGLENGARYYFAVAAYDTAGNLGSYSDEVSKIAGASASASGWLGRVKNFAGESWSNRFKSVLAWGN